MTVISCCSVDGGTCTYSKEYTANHLIMQTAVFHDYELSQACS